MVMKKFTIIGLFIGILSAVSCSKEAAGVPGDADLSAVTFWAESGSGSRAAGQMDEIAVDGYKIGVFAYDTGLYPYSDSNLNPNFMYNQDVAYNATEGRWEYFPVKYWPNGDGQAVGHTGEWAGMLSFFAYAPFSNQDPADDAGFCIPTISSPFEPGNPWVIYRIHEDVTKQVDLLCAIPVVDQTKPDVSSRINFVFSHALACVGEQVRVTAGSSLESSLERDVSDHGGSAQVILNEVRVKYTLTERAKLTLWSPGGALNRWSPVLNGEPTTERTVTYGTGLSHLLYSTDPADDAGLWTSPESMGVFYIPMDIVDHPQTATISVDYTVRRTRGMTTETRYTKESSFLLRSYPESFAPGHKLSNLGLTIN